MFKYIKGLSPQWYGGFFVRVCACLLSVLLAMQSTSCANTGKNDDESSDTAHLQDWIPYRPTVADIPSESDASLPTALTGTSAQSAVLMEADTGAVIFRQNESTRLPMASTTKIMTALVALEAMSPDTLVTVAPEAVGVEGSSIYLTVGEKLTLEDLLYALMLESANDAAVAIAVAVGGSVEGFADMMNAKAEALGLTDTRFVNPHGLDDPDHYTTAYELALIARAALENEHLRTIASTTRKTIPMSGDSGVRLLLNHNKMLRLYEGAIGLKTGFTKKSGRCLVSAAERDGVTLIAVTLAAPNDWDDHTVMLDYGFSLYESVTLAEPEHYNAPLWVISGTQEYVMVANRDALAVPLRHDHETVRCVVELPSFIYAPIANGTQVGRLIYYEETAHGNNYLGEVPLYATYDVGKVEYPQTLWERIKGWFVK